MRATTFSLCEFTLYTFTYLNLYEQQTIQRSHFCEGKYSQCQHFIKKRFVLQQQRKQHSYSPSQHTLLFTLTHMLDHVGFRVQNFSASKMFYKKALAPLGIKPIMGQDGMYFGFGTDQPFFWISARASDEGSASTHVAFAAKSKEEVETFYNVAVEVGGKDNGAPGYRAEYHPGYYAAFILDPDGNNIEVVFHEEA